jgi:hypothetical protein
LSGWHDDIQLVEFNDNVKLDNNDNHNNSVP